MAFTSGDNLRTHELLLGPLGSSVHPSPPHGSTLRSLALIYGLVAALSDIYYARQTPGCHSDSGELEQRAEFQLQVTKSQIVGFGFDQV